MASAPQQQQTQAERDQLKLGQEQTAHARKQSAPLQAEYRKKMNRDDSGLMAGMASADVMQAAGTDRTGQLLAGGQGGGHTSTGLGGQLQQATGNAGIAALDRQDGMKSNYNALGNKKNMNAVASLNASARAASGVASAHADSTATEQNAMMDSVTGIAGAYGIKKFDDYDVANTAYNKAKKGRLGKGHPSASGLGARKANSLRDTRDNMPGASWFKKFGDY